MDVLCDLRDQVGESPLWSTAEQALWWVDIEGRALRRWAAATQAVQSWPTPERIACIALHAQGGLVAGMESGIFHLRTHPRTDLRTHPRPQAGDALESILLARARHAVEGMRFNDGRCDRAGRFWAGTMVRDMALASPAGALHRFDRRGLSAPLVEGLVTQNGLAFSADNRTAYLSDSHPSVRRIWAFDLRDDGSLAGRREFVDMNPHRGRPDGAAIDADGCYWTCANDGGALLRFTPDGRLDRTLAVPVAKPSMCAFGGADLATLFITSIRPARAGAEADGAGDLAGAVFATRPGVSGLAETPFQP